MQAKWGLMLAALKIARRQKERAFAAKGVSLDVATLNEFAH